jgi:hypothetical protein
MANIATTQTNRCHQNNQPKGEKSLGSPQLAAGKINEPAPGLTTPMSQMWRRCVVKPGAPVPLLVYSLGVLFKKE